jgi:hypothetical protein
VEHYNIEEEARERSQKVWSKRKTRRASHQRHQRMGSVLRREAPKGSKVTKESSPVHVLGSSVENLAASRGPPAQCAGSGCVSQMSTS